MEFFKENLPETPGMSEPQRSAEKTNGDQKIVQPVSPIGQTPDSTQPTTQPVTSVTPQQQSATPAAADPFDLSRLRLSQDFASKLAVKKELVAVPVSKRHRQEWFRVHSDPTMRFTTTLLEWKEDGQYYLVDPIVAAVVSGEVFLAELFVTINKNGDINLWPVRLPGDDGKWHDAHRTSFEAAQLAITKWVRMVWNKPLGAYDIFSADYTDPEWPAVDLQTLVKIAFKERFIRDANHPIARSLRGV